jgi:protein-disulfide isomerase
MRADPQKPALRSNSRPNARRALVGGLVLLLALAALVLVWLKARPAQSAASPTADNAAQLAVPPSLGPADAPVTITEYGDFGCVTCLSWYRAGVLEALRQRYGDQIRFVWRDFPVVTALSPRAAEAGQCANEQGKFWEFHDQVYQGGAVIGASALEAYASRSGLDLKQFDPCLVSQRYQALVSAERAEATRRGISAPPAFDVNGKLIFGPQKLEVFTAVIDPILAAQK